jgi:hypothetical protein
MQVFTRFASLNLKNPEEMQLCYVGLALQSLGFSFPNLNESRIRVLVRRIFAIHDFPFESESMPRLLFIALLDYLQVSSSRFVFRVLETFANDFSLCLHL